jgi:glyoxylase-like metal-dependent hydrolase (beta-lactamase superfamily II)
LFELIQAAENTYYINNPAKIGIYRLTDNEIVLIDSGNDKEAGRKILKIATEKNWKIKAIINTHSNADHIGGNKFLAERTGCKIFAKGMERVFCEYPILETTFLFGAFPVKHLRHKFFLAEASETSNIEEFPLPEGMEILPLKGHFFDMIGIRTPDDVCFIADCVSSEMILEKYPIPFIYDVAEHLKTLDFVENLSGKMIIPSHAEAREDIKPLVHVNRQRVMDIINNIRQICEKPSSFEEILKKMFDSYNVKLDIAQYALAGSTIRSFLSYMVDGNILGVEAQNNYLLWGTSQAL